MNRTFSLRFDAALRALGLVALVLLSFGDARGEPLVVSGTRYESLADFLYGTWEWKRPEPRQAVQMRFSLNGDFFYNNFTTELIHYGRFVAKTNSLELTISRSCSKGNCNSRNPPLVVSYPIQPEEKNLMYSAFEKCDRLSRE